MKKNLIVGQSGGPTAVINSSLYGVIRAAKGEEKIESVYGMIHGIEGFLQGKYMDLSELEEGEKLLYTPAAFLGTCRYKLPEDLDDPVYPEILQKLQDLNAGYFCYIGGNDSMDTVSKLSRFAARVKSDICFIGIPKTIDNDLVLTDHTPGFGSAAKYVAQTVREIIHDACVYDKPSITIIEIMGRHAGWLTAASVLARKNTVNPYLIYLPELAFDEDKFLGQVREAIKKVKRLVICVSEGIHDASGNFVCETGAKSARDSFGHAKLTGAGRYLESLIQEKIGVKVRSVEFSVIQRSSAALMSKTDQQEALQAGEAAVRAVMSGETGKMVAFERVSDSPYKIECVLRDVNLICNLEKTVPLEWITREGSDVGEEFLEYVRPLIQGKVEIPEDESGLGDFLIRSNHVE